MNFGTSSVDFGNADVGVEVMMVDYYFIVNAMVCIIVLIYRVLIVVAVVCGGDVRICSARSFDVWTVYDIIFKEFLKE